MARLLTALGVALTALGVLGWWLWRPPPRIGAWDWSALETSLHARIEEVAKRGQVPIFDIEAHYDAGLFPPAQLLREMDQNGVAVIAMQPKWLQENLTAGGVDGWEKLNERLVAEGQAHFFPVTSASMHEFEASPQDQKRFVDGVLATASAQGYPMMGEFYFRRYPRSRDYRAAREPSPSRDPNARDFDIAIDGPLGEEIFSYANEHRAIFQIHYEVEERLLPALEKMLSRYPNARVIWCHVGRVRYPARAPHYDSAYVRRLLHDHPNLYFDTSEGRVANKYEGSGEVATVMWEADEPILRSEWRQLISDYPDRFLAAVDLGTDRMSAYVHHVWQQRRLLDQLPPRTREAVGFRSAWKLIFGRDF